MSTTIRILNTRELFQDILGATPGQQGQLWVCRYLFVAHLQSCQGSYTSCVVHNEGSIQPCLNVSSMRSDCQSLATISSGKKSITWHRTDAISSPIQMPISNGWQLYHHFA